LPLSGIRFPCNYLKIKGGIFVKLSKTIVGAICIVAAIGVGAAQWYAVNAASTAAVPVVCARIEIPVGTQITKEMLEVKKMGKLNLPANITGNAAQIVGAYADTDIQPDDIITGGKLSGHAPAYSLQNGQMLYSVALKNLADSLSGKLQNGDIVQVVVPTQTTGNNAVPGNNADALTALQYVRVEGVTASNGQDVNAGNVNTSSTTSNQPATVTLVVNQQQVSALAALGQQEIQFALVSRGDESREKSLLNEQAALLEGMQK
jgi:pilus assembly protein CpaB